MSTSDTERYRKFTAICLVFVEALLLDMEQREPEHSALRKRLEKVEGKLAEVVNFIKGHINETDIDNAREIMTIIEQEFGDRYPIQEEVSACEG